MKVLVIPEDPTLDQYIVKPVVERVMADAGVRARVDVLRDPHLRGLDQAVDPHIVAEIVRDNPMQDLFLLIVDRDCDRYNNASRVAARVAEHEDKLLACLAVHEVEVWMLALHRERIGAGWRDVRNHCDPKEAFADPFLAEQGWGRLVGRGRKRAMRSIGASWRALKARCPELEALVQEVRAWCARRG